MSSRITSLLIRVGVVASALAVLPFKVFELDRYFVPKELILHVVAVGAIVMLLMDARVHATDAADALLALFVAVSAVSTVFATNHWIAQRALGITTSSALVFWAARRLGADGRYRPIVIAAALAGVCAALTGLAQTYGFETDYFSLNRAPGGTFGNRNFVAHFCVIALPALVYVTITARRALGALLGSIGALLIAALLVLSRSRGAWLGMGASVVVVAVALFASHAHWRTKAIAGRFWRMMLAAAVGICAAIALPNRLNWVSNTPYLDSALSVADYSSGSGKGRLIQYTNSLRMAAAHPALGVGPGNWPVRYVPYATRGDGSIADDGMTANPWPSSDWLAFLSERGFLAASALVGVFALLFLHGLRGWSELVGEDEVLARVTLLGTIAATLVVGAFDAVLLLGAPALLAWSIIGATSGVGVPVAPAKGRGLYGASVLVASMVTVLSLARSAAMVGAISTVGPGWSRAQWNTAVRWDPGSFRINEKVAEMYAARGQCRAARDYAHQAASLFPSAPAPKRVLRRCS
jgi:O-antigen ligase